MNELGREKLVEAALKGVRQIKGYYSDGHGGYCALGVLGFECGHEKELGPTYDIRIGQFSCDLCGELFVDEGVYIAHLNDDHGLDFLTIARKV